jgi:glycosyltransferase involved in cell wall biosynthesis
MSNVLYIGPYREFTRSGNTSRQYIQSLIETGHDISLAPIYNRNYSAPEATIEKNILDLEKKTKKKYHTIIQHCYPHQITYDARFDKHVCITNLESKNCPPILGEYLDCCDNIVVPSKFCAKVLSGFLNPDKINIVPEPIDFSRIEKYKNKHKKNITDKIKFYAFSDFNNKKNLHSILSAFFYLNNQYSEIELVIKIKNNKIPYEEYKSIIDYELNKQYHLWPSIKQKPKIISGDIAQEQVWYIHNDNNCLISIDSSESFGYPALEALSFDNSVISLKDSPSYELDQTYGVDYTEEPCMDDDKTYPIYNGFYEVWKKPKIESLISMMELAILASSDKKILRANLSNYSTTNVASLFNQII